MFAATVLVALFAGGTVLLFASAAGEQQGPQKSVWDGVYTEEQAERGAEKFEQECAECHLGGDGSAPELINAGFVGGWDQMTVGFLFDTVSVTMPDGSPGTLEESTYIDVLAYLFKANGFPAGDEELPVALDALEQILILAEKPKH